MDHDNVPNTIAERTRRFGFLAIKFGSMLKTVPSSSQTTLLELELSMMSLRAGIQNHQPKEANTDWADCKD